MRPPRLRRAREGVVDLPFRLLLSVLLMVMAAVILLPVLQSYQQGEVERRIELVVAEISAAAREVYHNPGSSRTLLVDVPPAGGVHLEYIVIGNDPTGEAMGSEVIAWKHSRGEEQRHVVSTAGGHVPLAGPDGGPLVLRGHRVLLVLEAKEVQGPSVYDRYVEVRIA